MIITVLNVSQPKEVKTYFTIEVNYKDGKGQTQGKKLMSFSAPDVYNTLKDAQSGEQYDIAVKQEGQYWNWVGAKKLQTNGVSTSVAQGAGTAQSRGTYETAEEREKRQRLIVRQSSLTAALNTLSVGAKTVDKKAVKELAEEYTSWVFEENPSLKDDTVNFDDFGDDLPD